MRSIDRRLTVAENKVTPKEDPAPKKYLNYWEDPRGGGLYRRGEDTSGRLMTKDEVRADAAAAGAKIIFVEYESRDMSPEAGIMAGPDLEFGEGTTAIFLPNNHRSELE